MSESEAWRIYDAVGRSAAPSALLRLYYAADGDPVESLWRRQSDGYAEVEHVDHPEAVVETLSHALPELGAVRVRLTREALILATERHTVSVSQVVRHARVATRTRKIALSRPRHVVQGVNTLLSYEDQPRRFIELVASHGRHAFAAADGLSARALLEQRATVHADLDALISFAGWDRGPSIRAVG
ncbi:MAG: hypothetical protein AB7S26_19365 [Sandaracinaceae bacterium]